MAIPKIIHYCWLSGEPYPELIQKCIDSWKEKLVDYEIICWDTNNFDVNICDYTAEAFSVKKYAFVSDYIRLYALYQYGGIYLDSDIEVIRSFDMLLEQEAFSGFESKHAIAAWIFASEKGNPLFKELLDYYTNKKFILENGSIDMTPNTVPVTQTLRKYGLELNGTDQSLKHIHIYPVEYFCPYTRATGELSITDHTYTRHYFKGAWISDEKRKIISKRKEIISKYGKIAGYVFYGYSVLRLQGVKQFLKEFSFFLK